MKLHYLFLCLLCGCGEKPAAMTTNEQGYIAMPHMTNALIMDTNAYPRSLGWNDIDGAITNYSRTAMEAGFILGWEAHKQGGTQRDYLLLRNAIFSNQLSVMQQWFQSRK